MRTRSPLREGLKAVVANLNQEQMANNPLPDLGECGKEPTLGRTTGDRRQIILEEQGLTTLGTQELVW